MRKWIIVFGCMLIVFNFWGCASIADEERMRIDLEEDNQYRIREYNEEIKEFTIDKRETDKKQGIDLIWCTVTTQDAFVEYQKEAVLTYILDKKEGWILEDIAVEFPSQWEKTPLQGATENNVMKSLYGLSVVVNDETWEVTENNILEMSIVKHNTKLDEGIDIVTVSLKLDSPVEEAEGELQMEYVFDTDWELESIIGDESFSTTMKPQYAFKITNEELIDELVKQELLYGDRYEQTISIDKELISDFQIVKQESSQKGTNQILECKCRLSKKYVTFDIEANYQYQYEVDNGWSIRQVLVTPQVTSVDLEGQWKGTYVEAPWGGTSILNITNYEDDGSVMAEYAYRPEVVDRWSTEGSYYVEGELDMNTLELSLQAGDGIKEDEGARAFTKSDIIAVLYVDDMVIKGLGQNRLVFTVQK